MNDRTPTFRIEILIAGCMPIEMEWPGKKAGKPTDANLIAFVALYENANGDSVNSAEIIRQANGDIEATYSAAA